MAVSLFLRYIRTDFATMSQVPDSSVFESSSAQQASALEASTGGIVFVRSLFAFLVSPSPALAAATPASFEAEPGTIGLAGLRTAEPGIAVASESGEVSEALTILMSFMLQLESAEPLVAGIWRSEDLPFDSQRYRSNGEANAPLSHLSML
jgi:hypothetical protein